MRSARKASPTSFRTFRPAAFSTSLRRHLRAASLDVDEFREQAALAVGAEPPEPVKLRRVTKWSAVQMVLLALAAYTIVDAAAGVDWSEVASTVSEGAWGWLILAAVVAQLPRVTQALSTLGSVPASLPFGGLRPAGQARGSVGCLPPCSLVWLS